MNVINILIILSTSFCAFFYVHNQRNVLLFLLLALALSNELLTVWLNHLGRSYALNTTIYSLTHNVLWFLILLVNTDIGRNAIKIIIGLYLTYGLINLTIFEGIKIFNFNTHIVGALLYILLFIFLSFHQLKKENFQYFTSNAFLLLFAPILFFFGSSFVFGFKSEALAKTTLLGDINLYTFIIYFVNIIYYTLINIYIYREKKLNHA